MSYQVYLDGNLMHSPYIDKLQIYNPVLNLEQNAISNFEFDIQTDHPYYDNIARMKSVVQIMDDNKVKFKGRVIEIGDDTYKTKTIYCESVLGYLIDSIQSPYEVSGDISDLLTYLINQHNAQVEEEKQFKVGTITVTDPNNYISRSDTQYLNTWDSIKKKLVDILGGYIRLRYESDGTYIDYLADYTTLNSQDITFGDNLLTVEKSGSASDIATVVIPLGAKQDDTGLPLTIEEVNDGKNYVEDTEAVEKYGRIVQTVTYDDITLASNLKTRGTQYLNSIKNVNISIEVNAVDMASVQADISSFDLYSKIHVISKFHDIDDYFVPLKLQVYLFQPESNKVTLNSAKLSLTEADRNDMGMIDEIINNVYNNAQTNISHQVNLLLQQLTTAIEQSATEIRTEVSESYYTKGDTDELIEQTQTAWIQDKESFEFQFNQFRQDLDNIVNGNNAEFEDIRKYIRFIDGDINLGQVGNEFQCWIAKDKISFYQGSSEVAYFSNSKLYVDAIEIITSLKIGKFQFVPRSNGNLSFKWVG